MQNHTTETQPTRRPRRGLKTLLVLIVSLGTLSSVGVTAAHANYSWQSMTPVQSANYAFASNYREHDTRRYFDRRLDWSTDGCSASWISAWSPYYLDFYPACVRHDFGYRNFGKKSLDRNEVRRLAVDWSFYSDMQSICGLVSWLRKPLCYQHAYMFYLAVRNGGWTAFYG